jgi:CMP/dCMP kinase
MIITIDGPAASGKSTVAKSLAKKLGFYYLYTGLLYRSVGYVLAEKRDVLPDEFSKLTAEDLKFIDQIKYVYEDGKPKIIFEGEDITSKLKDSSVDKLSSLIGANKYVRQALLPTQRDVAKSYDIIADGRDCGSVVFPNADYKFFLTASIEERAKRKSKMGGMTQKEAEEFLRERDERDKNRDVAPLVVPEDAVIIDNSNLDIEQTLHPFLKYIKIG